LSKLKLRELFMVRVLSLGRHRELLRSRERLLESAGFKVASVTTRNAAERLLRAKRFNVLVVGHAVPIRERIEAAVLAKSMQGIPVVCMYLGSIFQAESADAILSADGSPEDLISTIHRLVAGSNETAGFAGRVG
jgi:CheY-like chemotaxis protein